MTIAERFESSRLYSIVGDRVLPGLDFGYDAEDGDDVVSLITSLSESPSEAMKDWSVALISKAIEWITEDTSDWDNLEYASSLIAQLENINTSAILQAAAKARSRIDDEMHEKAYDAFEQWYAYSNEASSSRPSEMERIVDYASQYANAAEIFPAFAEASHEIAYIREQERESGRKQEQPHDSQTSDEEASVHNILESLRETNK